MSGNPDLVEAIVAQDVALVKQLLNSGADVNATYHMAGKKAGGWTGLHLAAESGRVDIAALLLEHGARLEAEDAYGNTPLFKAVFGYRGEGAIIELLLRQGADVNHQNHSGVTPKALAHLIANYDVKQYFPSDD